MEITAISVVPPPISTIIFPTGLRISIPEPIAAALGQIDGITMYGSGNEAKLVSEIQQHGDQIFAGLNKTLGIDLKSLLLGYFGDKVISNKKAPQNS